MFTGIIADRGTIRAARPGDAILTIGAGNVSRAPGELAILLGARVSLHHAH